MERLLFTPGATRIPEPVLEAMSRRDEREQLIFSLLHYERLTKSEVAELLGISSPRVSQINSEIVKSLAAEFREDREILEMAV